MDAPAPRKDRLRVPRLPFHYGWLVAGLAFLVLLVSAGTRSTPGVLMRPMEAEMGWTSATISIAVAINIVLYGALGPVSAALMQTIGIRRTMLIGLGVIAVSTLATSQIHTPLQLVLTWGVGVGFGVGMIGIVVAATVATRWFVARRGTAIGILTSATAIGQLVFLPALAFVGQDFGWRAVGIMVSAVAVIVAIPTVLFLHDTPESIGLRPYGAPPGEPVSEAPLMRGKNPLRTALCALGRAWRKRDFWLLSGTFFVCGASSNGFIGTHFIPACGDHGIPEVRAAGYLAMMGAFNLVGTTITGFLSDRWSNRAILFWVYGLRGVALLFAPYALATTGAAGLPLFAIFYGLDWVATVPPTVKLTVNAFGSEEAPIVFGWISTSHQIGAGMIALVAGVIRTQTLNYDLAFVFSAMLCFVAAVTATAIGAGRSTPSVRDDRGRGQVILARAD